MRALHQANVTVQNRIWQGCRDLDDRHKFAFLQHFFVCFKLGDISQGSDDLREVPERPVRATADTEYGHSVLPED